MSRPLRVLRVITRLNIGGPAIHAILLNQGLDRGRFQSRLVTGTEAPTEGSLRDLAEQRGVAPLVLPELGRELNPLNDLLAAARLARLMRRLRPDIVHTHMAKAGTTGRLAARLAGVPIVIHTYHGHVFHSYFSPAKTWLVIAIERALALLTDRLVAVGEKQRREIASYGIAPLDKIQAIPLGLELDRFLKVEALRGQVRQELGFGPEERLVGIVARLVPIKAHEVFLQAAVQVHRQEPRARFLVVGDGERRRELEALARDLGLAEATRFLGWRSDLERLYAELDVVALSSLNEGSPVALIEAMAAGRPVVSTDVGGVSEVVQHRVSGLLVPPRDSQALADALLSVLREPGLGEALGQAARAAVYPRYASRRLIQDVESLYLSLARQKGLPTCS